MTSDDLYRWPDYMNWSLISHTLWQSTRPQVLCEDQTHAHLPSVLHLHRCRFIPSFHNSFLYSAFPSHLACLSISLLIPGGLKAFLLCLSRLVCIWVQTLPFAYLGLDIILNVMLPRHGIYCRWAAQTWTHMVRQRLFDEFIFKETQMYADTRCTGQ